MLWASHALFAISEPLAGQAQKLFWLIQLFTAVSGKWERRRDQSGNIFPYRAKVEDARGSQVRWLI